MSRRKPCECPRCRKVPTANKRWGFDEAEVPNVKCLVCKKKIGNEPYVVETGMARFGIMQFRHKRCTWKEN